MEDNPVLRKPSEDAVKTATPRLRRLSDPSGGGRIELSGDWNLRNLQPHFGEFGQLLAGYARDAGLQWDLRDVAILDDAGALLIWRAWGRRRPIVTLRPEHGALFSALESSPAEPRQRQPGKTELLVALGRWFLRLADRMIAILSLAGQLLLDTLWLGRNLAELPWREISANIHRTGGQALPITALVGFLVGVVLSYLSAQQLRTYGANIFIVNILGIGIIRELGPLLAAILVAGRSGSSMTAQLGVMRVTQELDALSVMGISHTLRLVLPKVTALAITLPLLVLWTDAIALIGGMVAADWQLGITYRQFLHDLPNAVPVPNLWLGLGKGAVFGILIALIACHFGLRVKPNTESLGIGTTESVVAAITVVIVVDAIAAVMFSEVGWR
jgi:phospholipid/cholesterol/gamma-HCH transport system permease protein